MYLWTFLRASARQFLSFVFCLFLVACGGGGGSDSFHSLSGAAVKGPLKDASVSVYAVDYSSPDFRGSKVAEGTTGHDGSFVGLTLSSTPEGFYLVEVSVNSNTVDISTGVRPIIESLTTLISAEDLIGQEPVYATPITSLVVALSQTEQVTSDEELASLVKDKSEQVVEHFGFGLLNNVDIFSTPPVIIEGEIDPSKTLAHRTAIEALASLIWDMANEAGIEVEQAENYLLMDLADGKYDGLGQGQSDAENSLLTEVYNVASGANVSELEIPNTTKAGDSTEKVPLKVGEVAQMLVQEAEVLALQEGSEWYSQQPEFVLIEPIGADMDNDGTPDISDEDIDGDEVPNVLDDLPYDTSDSVDSDGDGVGDNTDQYPTDAECHESSDGDGESCYKTIVSRSYLYSSFVDSQENIYLFLSDQGNRRLVKWDLEAQTVAEEFGIRVYEGEEEVYPTQVHYHSIHERIYIAYRDNSVRYIDPQDASEPTLLINMADEISTLTQAGRYLAIHSDRTLYAIRHDGSITDETYASYDFSMHFAWNEASERLFQFRDGTGPNDIVYQTVTQTTGDVSGQTDSPYHGDFLIKGPILIEGEGAEVLLGSGDVYDANSLQYIETRYEDFDFAHRSSMGLNTISNQDDDVSIFRVYDSAGEVTYSRTFSFQTEGLFPYQDHYVVLSIVGGKREFQRIYPNLDVDGDGVDNLNDAFPNNSAASVDSDNDGWPDAWNPDVDESGLDTDLQLDSFPLDSACQLTTHGVEGRCDVTAQINIDGINQVINYQNTFYLLDSENHTVYLWDKEAGEYRNPVLLDQIDERGLPLSVGINQEGALLVGYDSGVMVEVSGSLPITNSVVQRFSKGVHQILTAGDYLIAVMGDGNHYRDYYTLDSQYNVIDTYDRGDAANDYAYNSDTKRFYWFTNTYSDSIESYKISTTGEFTDFKSYSYSNRPTNFMSVSQTGDFIMTGDGTVIRNFERGGQKSALSLSNIEGDDASDLNLIGHVWFDDISVTAFERDEQVYLAFWDENAQEYLYQQLFLDGNIIEVFGTEAGLVIVYQESSGRIDLQRLPILGDFDQDGIPLWWEAHYELSDDNADDASMDPDSDGLSNIEEFSFSTSPYLNDTDADGISDAEEVNVYQTDPTSSDTDADLLPDGWEIEHGLDPNSRLDASVDSDGDGYSNLIEYINGFDPNDSESVPVALSNTYYSFEDGSLPGDWRLSGDIESVTFDENYASDGAISMSVSGNASIHWYRVFSPVEVRFDARSSCYSSRDSTLNVYQSGERVILSNPPQTEWETYVITLGEGYHEIDIQIDSSNPDCGLHIDNIQVEQLSSVYQMGASIVSSYDQRLHFIDNDGQVIRSTEIPENDEYTGNARDISVLEDGRIAVYNGTFSPYLSIYIPERHEWQHIEAPGWSTVNNGTYGGIDAIGDVVIVTNMATSGSQSTGFVVFELSTGVRRYINREQTTDLTVGLDGYLYGTNGRDIWKYDASTYDLVSSVQLDDVRGMAVAENGDIFVATWGGKIRHYNPEGTLLNELQVDNDFYDISLRATGDIVVGERSGEIYVTNTQLDDYRLIDAPGEFVDYVPDLDTDSDGLPDWWEHANDLDPSDISDASTDADRDGLDALAEYGINTKANKADTDQDGVNDGEEHLVYDSNPLVADTDGDSLTDGEEVSFGTDPTEVDTDGDTLSDAVELNEYLTDPLLVDSDSDEMPDNYEILHGLDPLMLDASGDEDGDGLSNLEEAGLDTDPNNSDSDGDLLTDFEEHTVHSTDPLNEDSDGDLMSDGWELSYFFDPLDATDATNDGDSDQFNNLEEFLASTSPTDPASIPEPTPWHTYQGDASHSGYTPLILSVDDFELRWSVSLPNIDTFNPVSAAEGKVFASSDSYFGGQQGIYALDAVTGEVIWEKNYDGIHSIDPPAYLDGKVVYQTGGHSDSFIRSVDATSGELMFSTAYSNQWSTYLTPTLFEGDIYTAGGLYGGVYSFDGTNGAEQWFANAPQEDGFTPAVDENYVYAFVNRLYVYDRISGESLFTLEQERGSNSYLRGYATVLSQLGNVVVVQSNALTVFDPENRSVLWELESSYQGQPTVAANTIYTLDAGNLKALNEQTGELLWSWEASESLQSNIIVTKSVLFVGGQTTTYAVDLETHQEVWSYSAAGSLSLSDEGALYIAGSSLVAISLSGDEDEDGLPAWWENQYGLDDSDPADASVDSDEDLLDALAEYEARTNPLLADTDGDTLSDYDELMVHQTNPLSTDSDSDTLSDADEISIYLSSPLLIDSDGDSFSDPDEVLLFQTDPADADSIPESILSLSQDYESGEQNEFLTVDTASAGWVVSDDEAYEGNYSFSSQDISDNQTAATEFTSVFATGNLEFMVKLETESCCDTLRVYIDAEEVWRGRGETDWQPVSISVTSGAHEIRLEYSKDSSVSRDRDKVWIDNFSFSAN